MSFLDDILGMGFSGYARLDNRYFFIDPSNVSESENLTKSANANAGAGISVSVGQPVSRQRRSLDISLSTPLSQESMSAALDTCVLWRSEGSPGRAHDFELVVAGGEGFRCQNSEEVPTAYVESVTINSDAESIATVSFTIKAWTWFESTSTGSTPRVSSALSPFDDKYAVIPGWLACCEHTGTTGFSVNGWSVTMNNNWQYRALLEAAKSQPPDPRVIYPGPLDVTMDIDLVAERDTKPAESGTGRMLIGNPNNTSGDDLFDVVFPTMVRDPQRSYGNFATPNVPVAWRSSWYGLSLVPQIVRRPSE